MGRRASVRFLILLAGAGLGAAATAQELDLVLAGGRVRDPASGLDAVRNIGVRDGRVIAVSETPLEGRVVIDAGGLVVAPGFIDRHAHERGALPLMQALAKMTILPARRLEPVAPAMARKGRISVGADADLTVFDPATVIDRATYESPAQPSAGIVHVLVAGTFVLRDGVAVDGVYPGQPILGER